jgi:hypothetical protein
MLRAYFSSLLCSVSKLAEMAAIGLGLAPDAFSSAGTYGYVFSLLSAIAVSRASLPNLSS